MRKNEGCSPNSPTGYEENPQRKLRVFCFPTPDSSGNPLSEARRLQRIAGNGFKKAFSKNQE